MRCRYSNSSPVSPYNTVLDMLDIYCSVNAIRSRLDGLIQWLEFLTALNIIYWLIERIWDDLPRIFYSGASGVLFSVIIDYSTTSAGTGVGLFYTLGGIFATLVPGASLFTLVDASEIGMAPVVMSVAVVVVKIYSRYFKAYF